MHTKIHDLGSDNPHLSFDILILTGMGKIIRIKRALASKEYLV